MINYHGNGVRDPTSEPLDAAYSPKLFTVEDLDSDRPLATDRSSAAHGVGAPVLNATQQDLYYWIQGG